MNKKIKIAFIKFGGLSAGGTEKFLQVLAVNLPTEYFTVDYFYCDSAPYIGSNYKHLDTDPERVQFMEKSEVNLIKFNIDAKDINSPTHDWVGTDFWKKFDENNYDIIQTGRGGYPEYPFTKIKRTPIVDSLHLSAGIDNQYNISRVLHISKWSADQWVKKGGDASRVEVISTFLDIPKKQYLGLREKLDINNKFIFGFHQRKDDWIYSPIPLDAYKKIESENTVFLMLNGSDLYKKQANDLNIKNIIFLPYAETQDDIYDFVSTLDVFSHGRKDGEVNSAAIAEAMYFGLPIVSHSSSYANGHIECIGEGGRVLDNTEDYAVELKKLMEDKEYYKFRSSEAKKRFSEMYELKNQIAKIVNIYKDVIQNPFPNKLRRLYFDLVNRIKKMLYNRYTLLTYRKLKKILKK
jgi:glycosyltransferase involved in cell wall biosynthesis